MKKQKRMAVLMVGVILLSLFFSVGCKKEDSTETSVVKVPTVVAPTTEATMSEKEEREIKTALAVNLMRENFKGIATVEYNEKNDMVLITPTDEDIELALIFLLAGKLPMSHWYELRDSFIEASKVTSEVVGSGFSMALVNPSNTDNIILLLLDGKILYDAFE